MLLWLLFHLLITFMLIAIVDLNLAPTPSNSPSLRPRAQGRAAGRGRIVYDLISNYWLLVTDY